MPLVELDGVAYPLELRWVEANGFKGFVPWHLIDENQARGLRAELQRETATDFHTVKDLLPFAARQDRDDVAGFVVEAGSVTDRVATVHLTWSGGPEVRGYPSIHVFDTFWEWLHSCIDDTASWCDEGNFGVFFADDE